MMDPNMTAKTLDNRIARENSSLPSWRKLGVIATLLFTLVFVSSVAFAQPNTDPFAVPFDAVAGIDRAADADSDRWAAQGEYYADIYEASAVASASRSRCERQAVSSGRRASSSVGTPPGWRSWTQTACSP